MVVYDPGENHVAVYLLERAKFIFILFLENKIFIVNNTYQYFLLSLPWNDIFYY